MNNFPTSVIVPDFSVYDDAVDFVAVKKAGAAGVIIRAGQGIVPDAQLVRSSVEAPKAGLPIGYYWFLDPRVDPKRQAEAFAASVKDMQTDLPLFADYEAPDSWGGAFAGWKNLYNFLERLKQLTTHEIGIYTGYYYWQEHSPNPIFQSASLKYFAQYPLWMAWYAPQSLIKIPAPWTEMMFWQFTEGGQKPLGLDQNYFNGNLADFYSRFKVAPAAPATGRNITITENGANTVYQNVTTVDLKFADGTQKEV